MLKFHPFTIQTYFMEQDSSFFVSTQEQNTAVDGWNEQISQLTAECDQLKDSLQEITKVLVSIVFVVALFNLQTSNLREIVELLLIGSSQEMKRFI